MKDWLTQMQSFGLNQIELDYTLTSPQIEEIKKLQAEMGFTVSSVHNFCPTPNDEPSPRHPSNYYRLSSLDDYERNKAVEWTKRCVDTAVSVGGKVVVFHAGTIEEGVDVQKEFITLFKEGKRHAEEFKILREQVLSIRKENSPQHVDVLEQSLKEVVSYASSKNILMGLESRYYPIEMPNHEEIGHFLNLFGKEGMGYWHDVGHSEMNGRLGITPHEDYLESYKDQLIGVHLHGMRDARDHLAPFDGDMDLHKYLKYFHKDVHKVIESRFADEKQMKKAIEQLKKEINSE